MDFRTLVRPCMGALWPLLAFGLAMGLGVWGASQQATGNNNLIKAAYGCALASILSLALANAVQYAALLIVRRRHRDLLEAVLPLHSLHGGGEETPALFARTQADTPANLLLAMMGELLEGRMPSAHDVLYIRTALLSNMDVYAPLNLRDTIKGANLDADVAQSLMNQLGGVGAPFGPASVTVHSCCRFGGGSSSGVAGRDTSAGRGPSTAPSVPDGGDSAKFPRVVSAVRFNGDVQEPPCDSLSDALALILTPMPATWQDGGAGGADDLTSELTGPLELKPPPLPLLPPMQLPMPLPPLSAAPDERRTPNAALYGPSVAGLLDRAASLLDRSQRRRRSTEAAPPLPLPYTAQVPSVLDVRRDAGWRTSLHASGHRPMGHQRPSAGGNGGAVAARFDFPTQSMELRAAAARRASLAMTSVQMLDKLTGGGGATTEDDDDGAGNNTGDGDSCGGGGSGCRASPRRMSAVWGRLSKRVNAGKVSLDGNPLERDVATSGVPSGSDASPAAGPASFSALRAASLQGPMGHLGLEALHPSQSRLGLTAGSSVAVIHGSSVRTKSVRVLAELMGGGAATGSGGLTAGTTAAAVAAAAADSLKRRMPPPPAVVEEVERLLSQSDCWQFDSWRLQEASQGHALSALGFFLIQKAGLIKTLRIKPVTLARMLRQLEAGYLDNPYHNAVHAADVLQTLHVIIHAAQLHVHYLDPLGLLAAYFTAIIHDYGHPGLTSDFLIATADPLALTYNDRSPLENHHCAAAFGLMRQRPELDFLAPLSVAERTAFRKQVIELVLATDMKLHFSILSHFNTVHRLAAYSQQQQQQEQNGAAPGTPPTKTGKKVLRRTFSVALSNIADNNTPASSAAPTFAACWAEPAPKPADETERLLSLQVALKAADIGHLGEELEVHKRWLSVLEEEFFHQGDRERALGLAISPLFDRAKQGVSKSQVGFYDFVALPLLHALSSAFPGVHQLMTCFVANYNHWRALDGQPPVEVPAAAPRKAAGRWSGQAAAAVAASMSTAPTIAAAVAASASRAPRASTRTSDDQGGLAGLLLTLPDDLEAP